MQLSSHISMSAPLCLGMLKDCNLTHLNQTNLSLNSQSLSYTLSSRNFNSFLFGFYCIVWTYTWWNHHGSWRYCCFQKFWLLLDPWLLLYWTIFYIVTSDWISVFALLQNALVTKGYSYTAWWFGAPTISFPSVFFLLMWFMADKLDCYRFCVLIRRVH